MKKTHKKILGLAGLFLVTAMTVFAAFLPSPGAVATNSSVTDTIVVRVLATTPNVDITGPEGGETFVKPEQNIDYTYENVETVEITITYTDLDGNTRTETIASLTPGGQPGSGSIPINLLEDYGYGDFVVTIKGTGSDGISDEKNVDFSFRPVTGDANQKDDTNKVDVNIDYDETSDDIDHIEINVYDKDGNLITPLSPVKVPKPNKSTELDFGDLPDGEYTIEIVAIDTNGNTIQPAHYVTIQYKAPKEEKKEEEKVVPVPNTGSGVAGLNITQTDYLITGIIIFTLAAICGAVVITKNRSDKKRR